MIQLLDLSRWHWTPQDILNIPESWADDLLLAHYCGWIIEQQTKKLKPERQ